MNWKTFGTATFSCWLLVIAGCSSQYTVSKVDEKLPKYLPKGGIYYSLPKTEIVVQIPVTQTVTSHGELSYRFDENVKKCKSDASVDTGTDDKYESSTKLERGRITLFTRAIPDSKHRYRLDVTADLFSSFTHTVEVTKSGILTSASSTVKDGVAEVALAVASTVADLAKISSGIVPAAAARTQIINCSVINEASNAIAAQTNELASIEADRKLLLLKTGLRTESDTLKQSIAYLDKRVAAVKKKYKKLVDKTKRDVKKKSKFVLLSRMTPNEFSAVIDEDNNNDGVNDNLLTFQAVALVPAIKTDETASTIPVVSGATAFETVQLIDISKLEKEIAKWKLKINVTPSISYATDCKNNCISEDNVGGYKYRISASGTIVVHGVVEVKDSNGQIVKESISLAQSTLPIAQYGPIAQLPNEFGGSDGNISLALFTDTGALKTVTVGSTPKVAENITAGNEILTGYLGAKETSKQAKETTQESKLNAAEELANNLELNQLRKEKEILELQKSIRELKLSLSSDDVDD